LYHSIVCGISRSNFETKAAIWFRNKAVNNHRSTQVAERYTLAWYQLESNDDQQLDKLALEHNLHPVHIEDTRDQASRIKIDIMPDYLFVTLKPLHIVDGEITESPLHIFAGRDFCITMADMNCQPVREATERASRAGSDTPPAKLLYLILDTIVDSYFLTIDHIEEKIDLIEDDVLDKPTPDILQKIFEYKRQLIDLRRIIVGTRDIGMHLQRDSGNLVDTNLYPFFRDVYDHLLRLADTIETLRDLMNNTLDVYLSSVANRTNQVMKVLTVLSTIALPAVAISGVYGMNLKGLPFEEHAHGAEIAMGMMLAVMVALLVLFKRFDWL
jgi:magnesium transporter